MTVIPFDDYGGVGPRLHFAHSNGYPPGCFRQLLAPLSVHYRILAAHHRPLWSGACRGDVTSWHVIADDLIAFLDQMGWQNVIGVGHSLGAVITMFAAQKRPDLIRALVLIDPTVLLPAVLQAIADHPEVLAEHPIVRQAWTRRDRWPSREAAFAHFRAKGVFERWSDDAIWNYVRFGLVREEAGSVTLAYTREWEGHMYTLTPTGVWSTIAAIRQPTLVIRGSDSDVLVPEAWQLWRKRRVDAAFVEIAAAGHMVLMERPQAVATTIRQFLEGFLPA